MKILIVGIGNPILRDDGVGVHVARCLQRVIGKHKDIEVMELNTQGLALAEAFFGYDKVILVDAVMTKDGKPGQIRKLNPDDFSLLLHASSPHDMNFITAIEACRRIDPDRFPKEIIVIGIEAKYIAEFGDKLSPEVSIAVPKAVKMILGIIDNWLEKEHTFVYNEYELNKVFLEILSKKEEEIYNGS